MAPSSRIVNASGDWPGSAAAPSILTNILLGDNFSSFVPCTHLKAVFDTKAKSTVKSTYQQAIEIFTSNSGGVLSHTVYTGKKGGDKVPLQKFSELKNVVLKCSVCSISNYFSVFICLQCPHVGCYQEHARMHARSQNHIFAIDSRNGLLYCFQCHDYTNNKDLDIIRLSSVSPHLAMSDSSSKAQDDFEGYTKPSVQAVLGLKGIVNLGSTCFMSCILQTILHNPFVRSYFFHNDDHFFNCGTQQNYIRAKEQIDEHSACITCSIDSIFKEYYTSSNTHGLGITNLLTTAWHKQKSLAGFSQQDAHEFWQFILNEFHTDYERVSGILNCDSARCECIMHSIFLGELKSSVICGTCKAITSKIDPFIDLSLEIDSSKTSSTLYNCLDQFTRKEQLDVKYRCRTCQKDTKAHRALCIKKIPPVLSFQLKRFKHDFINDTASKIENRVEIPFFLNLTDYMSSAVLIDNKDVVGNKAYELFALVNHTGSVNTGHYVTYIKRATGQWLKFDDSVISFASREEVQSTNAYLLFYIACSL